MAVKYNKAFCVVLILLALVGNDGDDDPIPPGNRIKIPYKRKEIQ